MMTRINFNNIPGVTPAGFVDYIVTDAVPIMNGMFEIMLETQQAIRLKNDPTYRKRPVQTIFYPKYKLTIPDSQPVNYELIKYGSKAYVIEAGETDDMDELTKEVVITDVQRTFTNQMWVITLEYYSISGNEYTRQVADYLKSTYLKTLGGTNYALYYDLYYSSYQYVRTIIEPVANFPDAELQTTTINDIEKINKGTQKEIYTFTFYCSQAEVIELKQNIFKYYYGVYQLGTTKQIITPRIERLDGWDLYRVEVDILKELLTYKL